MDHFVNDMSNPNVALDSYRRPAIQSSTMLLLLLAVMLALAQLELSLARRPARDQDEQPEGASRMVGGGFLVDE